MIYLTFLSFLLLSLNCFAALEYSKVEHPGCPENSFCSEETGKTKSSWNKVLNEKNMSISSLNKKLKSSTGFPVSGWALEEAQILPNIIMWDSPCKNHKNDLGTYYISDFFVKKIDKNFLNDYKNLYFPKAYIVNSKKILSSQIISREDLPSYVSNTGFHYLKTDEGKFYGLIIGKNGDIELSDVRDFTARPKNSPLMPMMDEICTKEQIDLFKQETPHSLFYESYYCKKIWNISTKSFDNILFGRSCD